MKKLLLKLVNILEETSILLKNNLHIDNKNEKTPFSYHSNIWYNDGQVEFEGERMVSITNATTEQSIAGTQLRYDKSTLEIKANEVLSKYSLNSAPVDLEKIIKNERINKLELNLRQYDFGTDDEVSGLITNLDKNFIIMINSTESNERKRFTLAHELGHFYLHYPDKSVIKSFINFRGGASAVESEANYFAACLLMPKEAVNAVWLKLQDASIVQRANFSQGALAFLSDLFEVSPQAMSIRLQELELLNG